MLNKKINAERRQKWRKGGELPSFGRSVINDYFPLPLTLSDTILFKSIDNPASLKRLHREATFKIACSHGMEPGKASSP
jgi:hypothetical protein